MARVLPQRRLLFRAGNALLTLDLAQVKDVGGVPSPSHPLLTQVLALRPVTPGVVALTIDSGSAPVTVAVDGVAGVVDVMSSDVLGVPSGALRSKPGLVRALMRVKAPSLYRGGSLVPTPVGQVPAGDLQDEHTVLAADLEPVALGRCLMAWQALWEGT